MSSIINRPAAQAEVPSNGQAGSRIVHFDATARRKEKMRQRATKEPSARGHERGNGSPATTLRAAPAASAPPAQNAEQDVAAPTSAERTEVTPPAPTQPASPPAAAAQTAPSTGKEGPATELPSGPELEKFLIDFVVEQTGYPEEMVELDADLEADLGIDSIKKAQLFGEMAEQFNVEVQGVEELSLDDFPTLRHVMDFLENASPASASANVSTSAAPAASEPTGPAAPPKATETARPAAQAAPPSAAAPVTDAAPAPPASSPRGPKNEPSTTATATAASSPAVTTAGTGLSGEELERFLIGFVVEQTGYPEEMVELDADLEADLGIDSIKKAQLFGEMAEHFDVGVVQVDEDLSLDDFPTLRHVMDFLENASAGGSTTAAAGNVEPAGSSQTVAPPQAAVNSPNPAASAAPAVLQNAAASAAVEPQSPPAAPMQSQPPSTPPTQAASPLNMSGAELEEFLVNFVVEQTGYPPEMVELDADLEADLGIDSIKKAQLFGEMAEQFDITIQPTDEELSLDDFPTLRHVMDFLQNVPAT